MARDIIRYRDTFNGVVLSRAEAVKKFMNEESLRVANNQFNPELEPSR
jgi:hypothetical protein